MTDDPTPIPGRRMITATEQAEDIDGITLALRPKALADFIGQEPIKRSLGIALAAARRRGEPLEHVLLSGPPGLGKTTLSGIIAREMGGNLVTTSGPALERAADLMGMLTNLERGDTLFVDEIHRLPRTVEEYLYPAMEDGKVDFILDKGPFARAYPIELQPFTLVGATTRSGMLSRPLRERFGMNLDMEFYPDADLQKIVLRSAGLLKLAIADTAALEVARRARGTPRIANRLLRRVRDYADVQELAEADVDAVRIACAIDGVDAVGLDTLDRRYLETLVSVYEGGPAGVQALAATMQQEIDTLEEVIEPYLLYAGFVLRTPQGRRASAKAYAHLQLTRSAA